MPPKRPCATCIKVRDDPHHRFPQHLVHPEHRKPMVFDVRGRAVCKHCGAVWRRVRNEVELLEIE